MSKKRPEDLSEMRQGWVYLDARGTLMWLTTKQDRENWTERGGLGYLPLWHLNGSGGTWQLIDREDFYPMTRLVRSDG